MSRREGLRLLAAGVLTVWLCLFLHWENTEKSMIRSLLVETKDDSWTVGLLYQFPEASADSSEAEAAIRLCVGRGPQLSAAIAAAEKALPQRADWRLCEYLFVEQDSVRRALPVCEELFLHQPCGRLASRMFGAGFSVETLEERTGASDVLPENLLQCVKNSASFAPRLYEQGGGFVLVEDAGLFLPDIEILFADGEQHGDVLGLDDMALAEAGTLELAGNDLGNIVAEHLPCRVFGTDQFHGFSSSPCYNAGICAAIQSASAAGSSSAKSAPGTSPTMASGSKETGSSETALRTTSILGQPLSLKPSISTRS